MSTDTDVITIANNNMTLPRVEFITVTLDYDTQKMATTVHISIKSFIILVGLIIVILHIERSLTFPIS